MKYTTINQADSKNHVHLSVPVLACGDLSDFERGLVVGARLAGLSILENAHLLGFLTYNHLKGLHRMVC